MDHIFEATTFFTVPDGTQVSPFLNATHGTRGELPQGLLGEMSIAAGRIGAGIESWIHRHPLLTQVTYVLSGELSVRTGTAAAIAPRVAHLRPGQAVVTAPDELFQLCNPGTMAAEVLYIVSPSYVFEMRDGEVIYDDAVLVARSWRELAVAGPDLPDLTITAEEQSALRRAALARLKASRADS